MENGNVKARTRPGGTATKYALCTFLSTLFALKVAGTIKPSALGYFVSDSVKEVSCSASLRFPTPTLHASRALKSLRAF